ncbi:MAG TPA: ABC transporter permease [Ohtaekwangia sp.]|uniref:ABC transporter permease n=1 Tax=Ohtaekwangia sp. TaxID=2066019 RepID=UPI002F947A27
MKHDKHSLPKWAERFLRAVCPEELYEEIEGDLIQQLSRNADRFGLPHARRKLCWSVIRFFRPGVLLRNKVSLHTMNLQGLWMDLVFACRRLRYNKLYAFLNILGLSMSIAVAVFIFQYAAFQLRYDRFHPQAENIYRIYTRTQSRDQAVFESALTNGTIGPQLKRDLATVRESCQLLPVRHWFDCSLKYTGPQGTVINNERKLYYTSPDFFNVFSYPLMEGDTRTALQRPFSIVLSERAASRYFHHENPMGKILHLKGSCDEHDYEVTGIMPNLPEESHLDAEILVSQNSLENNPYYKAFDCYTYLLLDDHTNIPELKSMLPVKKDALQTSYTDVQPITSIYLHASLHDEIKSSGDVTGIYIMLTVACIILTIAWINYINLSMAIALARAKEVGIRKVNGASRFAVARQFFVEAFVVNLISAAIAGIVVFTASPVYHEITGYTFSFSELFSLSRYSAMPYLLAIFATGIVLSALYPARLIASFNVVRVLKGKYTTTRRGLTLRKVLMLFQFSCSVVLIMAAFVIHEQFVYLKDQNLGIDIQKTLIVKAPAHNDISYKSQLAVFGNYLRDLSVVESVTTSTAIPGEKVEWISPVRKSKEEVGLNFSIHVVDTSFIDSYKLHLLAGRNFVMNDFPGEKFGQKTEPVILNERAVASLGFTTPGLAVGKIIYWDDNACVIVGVIDDFHQQSFKSTIQPVLFTANLGPMMSLKFAAGIDSKRMIASVEQIRKAWKKFFPENPFDYFFLENFYDLQYKDDIQLRWILDMLCILAIVTSCLGLTGLSVYIGRQRLKEVGIRKVLGANIYSIVLLLSRQFLQLIIVAIMVACPIAYTLSNEWLNRFASRIPLHIGVFAIPVIIVLLMTWLAVASQMVYVARSNPVDTLKQE